jgi:hypothetical protein
MHACTLSGCLHPCQAFGAFFIPSIFFFQLHGSPVLLPRPIIESEFSPLFDSFMMRCHSTWNWPLSWGKRCCARVELWYPPKA